MRSRLVRILILGVLIAAVLFFISRIWPDPSHDRESSVGASIYPVGYLLQRLSGEVVFQVTPSGVEPHDFEASPQDVLSLQSMELFVYNGAHLDAWAERIAPQLTHSGVRVINLAESLHEQGAALRTIQEEDQHEEDEAEDEDDHELEPGSTDPHLWLDPVLMIEQARIIAAALIAIHPDARDTYESRLKELVSDLEALDAQYAQGLATCRIRTIVASHDAFGYLSDRYDFEVLPLAGISPQQEPSARRIGELATLIRERGINYVFFETLVSPKLAETLAKEAGAETKVLNPVEGLTAVDRATGEDYMSLMEKNLAELRTAMDCR